MESSAQPGSRELPTLPVCQICGLDLSNARTFFRVSWPGVPSPAAAAGTWCPFAGTTISCCLQQQPGPSLAGLAPSSRCRIPCCCVRLKYLLALAPVPQRYRICEAHAAEKEQVVDGVLQRFCQQVGPAEHKRGSTACCRRCMGGSLPPACAVAAEVTKLRAECCPSELLTSASPSHPFPPSRRPAPQCGRFHTLDAFDADQKSCREELARHAARRRDLRRRRKASQGLAPGASGAAPSSSRQGGPADLTDLLAAAAQVGRDGQHSRHHHHERSRRRSGDPYRRVMVTGRQGMAAPGAAASPWAAASVLGQSPPEPSAAAALAAAAGTQTLPPQRSAPAGQPTAGWSASDAQALLNTLSAGIKPAASSGLMSSTTGAHLDVPNLAALSAALAGQAGSLPAGLGLGLGAAAAAGQQGLATAALGNAASDAVSGSGEYQAGLPPLPGMPPAGNSSAASAMAGLLQQLLQPPSVQIPSVRSVPLPLVQQVSLLPSAATAAPVHNPQLSAPVPGMHGGGGRAPANGGPVCQVCRSSLADMLPFYKVRER